MNYLEELQSLKNMEFENGSALYFHIQEHQEFREKLQALSMYFLERKLSNCITCYMDCFFQLCKLDLDFAKKKMDCKFRLKEGHLIYLNGNPITNYNLDNEKAVEYLKKHPEDKQRFSLVDENMLSETLSEPEEANPIIETKVPLKSKKKAGRPKKK